MLWQNIMYFTNLLILPIKLCNRQQNVYRLLVNMSSLSAGNGNKKHLMTQFYNDTFVHLMQKGKQHSFFFSFKAGVSALETSVT